MRVGTYFLSAGPTSVGALFLGQAAFVIIALLVSVVSSLSCRAVDANC